MPETINVTWGDAQGLMMGMAIPRKEILCCFDSLRYGRLEAIVDVESWRAMRFAQWESLERKPRNGKKRRNWPKSGSKCELLDQCERLADARFVRLWVGTGLAEQLVLVWMPQLLRAIGVPLERLWLIQFERTSTGATIPELGPLLIEEYKNHPPPRPIDDEVLATLDEAWSALIAPDPRALVRFINRPSASLPWLPQALKKLFSHFPDHRSGLNAYETQLLASTQVKGAGPVGTFANMLIPFDNSDDRVGNNWLFWRLLRIGDPTLPHPAVSFSGNQTSFGDTQVHLTEVGEKILRGKANFVELNGIDEWVSGVHLDSKIGNLWYHHGGTIVRGSSHRAG